MKRIKGRSLLAVAVFNATLLGFAVMGHAQTTTQISGGGTALRDAVAAATAGDTIEITDSLRYDGGVDINKQLTIVAASGQSPSIGGVTTSGSSVVYFLAGSAGSQLGSNDGGTITVFQDRPGQDYYTLRFLNAGVASAEGDRTVVENVVLEAAGGSTGLSNIIVYFQRTTGPLHLNVDFNNVVFDKGDFSHGSGIRHVTGQNPHNYDITITDSRFLGFDNVPAIYLQGGYGNLAIDRTHFDTTGNLGIALDVAVAEPTVLDAVNNWTITLEDTWIRTNGAWAAVGAGRVGEGQYTSLSLSRCAIVDAGDQEDTANIVFGTDSDNSTLTISHCDLINDASALSRNLWVYSDVSVFDASILDSNLIAGTANVENDAGGGTATIDNTLVLLGDGSEGVVNGMTEGGDMIDSGDAPAYADRAGGDFRYTNVNQTASTTGTPLGSNFDFVSFEGPEPSSTSDWHLFN